MSLVIYPGACRVFYELRLLVSYWPLALGRARGADTKIELGFSMSLRRATPGIRPEGRRLGTLRLGRRLDPQKIGLNPRAKVAAVEVSAL